MSEITPLCIPWAQNSLRQLAVDFRRRAHKCRQRAKMQGQNVSHKLAMEALAVKLADAAAFFEAELIENMPIDRTQMPQDRSEGPNARRWPCHTDGGQMVHPNAKAVGEQRDGYPGGDMQDYECPDCGAKWTAELPQ